MPETTSGPFQILQGGGGLSSADSWKERLSAFGMDPGTAPAPPRRGGRQAFLPLGVPWPGTRLRAPSSLPDGAQWPPSVREARAEVNGRRNHMRSAITLFSLGFALGLRGIQEGRVDDVAEAFAIFNTIASSENAKHFARYRALSLYNATVCMQALPSRSARAASDLLAASAMDALEGLVPEGVEPPSREDDDLLLPLRWRTPTTLHPDVNGGRARLASIDVSVSGTWDGVRGGLRGLGLLAPETCAISAPCLSAVRVGFTIRVGVA